MINWVVFDLGDVVLRRTTELPALARLLKVPSAQLTVQYWAHRRQYDLTSDPFAFWTAVAAGCATEIPGSELIAELVRVDDLGWAVADPDTLELVDDLAGAGTPLAVLSNAPSSMGRLIETAPWAGNFSHLLFSGDLGLVKPEPAIYLALLDRLSAPPAGVVFLDDRADNVAGALAAGLAALAFSGAQQARADLRAIGLPV